MSSLLSFLMQGVLTTEATELVHFKSIRIIFLVFLCVVIALLALSACQCDLYSCFISHDFGTSHLYLGYFPIICVCYTQYLPRKKGLALLFFGILLRKKRTSLFEVYAF